MKSDFNITKDIGLKWNGLTPIYVFNEDFSSATGWTLVQEAEIGSGVAFVNAPGSPDSAALQKNLLETLVVGRTYYFSIDLNITSGTFTGVYVQGDIQQQIILSKTIGGTYTGSFVASSENTICYIILASSAGTAVLSADNVKIWYY